MSTDRAYYSASIACFLDSPPDEILGQLARRNTFDLDQTQRDAWREEVAILRETLAGLNGSV